MENENAVVEISPDEQKRLRHEQKRQNIERNKELSTLARYCVTKSPGFAAIALWVPYRATDASFVARTNGQKIETGAAFFEKYEPKEQAFILMHEVLHVALRHIPRGKRAL